MSNFLEDLQKLGVELSSHEIPSSSELPGIVGSIVKVLEKDGATVADDLFPKAPEPEQPAGAPPAAPAADAPSESLLNRIGDTLKNLDRRLGNLESKQGPES